MAEAWIIDACRTPRGIGKKGKGALADEHSQHLGAAVLKALKERNDEHPFVFHMVEVKNWRQTITTDSIYYPPTYETDGFTHGTANPAKLLSVANHFIPTSLAIGIVCK